MQLLHRLLHAGSTPAPAAPLAAPPAAAYADHQGEGGDACDDAERSALAKESAMLERARECALRRTVVKRPKNAPPLGNVPPSHSVDGSTNRFDVYLT